MNNNNFSFIPALVLVYPTKYRQGIPASGFSSRESQYLRVNRFRGGLNGLILQACA
jgi:hypothetical protein